MRRCQCCFRVWVSPSDPPVIECFYFGIENTNPKFSFMSEWFQESFSNEDFHDLFDLDKEKCYQVVGKATITGSYDYYGEYDETVDIDEFRVQEEPEDRMP